MHCHVATDAKALQGVCVGAFFAAALFYTRILTTHSTLTFTKNRHEPWLLAAWKARRPEITLHLQ
jgi:hypothetical protein